jgi:putative sortase B
MEGQVGRLTVEGTEIDNAVMQAGDNDYYLRRNEYGEDDVWGCYFMDYACSSSSQNLVIYGHSLDDSTEAQRFSQLKRFSNPEWAAQHHTIQLEYNGQRVTYEVISAGLADATTDTIAIITNPGMEQAQQIIDAALERSDVQFEAGKSADPLSCILTLATCTTDSGTRYVVTAIQTSGDDTNAAD